jgi:hypothetical protein
MLFDSFFCGNLKPFFDICIERCHIVGIEKTDHIIDISQNPQPNGGALVGEHCTHQFAIRSKALSR